jgi:hypothetical protein
VLKFTCATCNPGGLAPDDRSQSVCARCGRPFAAGETATTDVPPSPSQAIREGGPEAYQERLPRELLPLPERYSSWEEFRSVSPAVQRELLHLIARPLPDLRSMRWRAIPEDAPDELTAWGKPVATIAVGGDDRSQWCAAGWLLIVLGVLVLAAGLYVGFPGQGPPARGARVAAVPWAPVVVSITLGGGAILVGAYWAILRGRHLPAVLWVFDDGVLFQQGAQSRVCRWQDVQDFAIHWDEGTPTATFALEPGLAVTLPASRETGMMALLEYMDLRVGAAQFLPRLQAIYDGGRERFGAVVLDRQGIQSKRFCAPWANVQRVVADAQQLFVEVSRMPQWLPLPKRDVILTYVVVAISAVMMDEHERLATDPRGSQTHPAA